MEGALLFIYDSLSQGKSTILGVPHEKWTHVNGISSWGQIKGGYNETLANVQGPQEGGG